MKFKTLFFVSLFLAASAHGAGIFLWESQRERERSCCICLNGVDICNPYVPCTRNVAIDLRGISDYISRILQVDKGSSFSYQKILTQAQDFIAYALQTHMRLFYRFDTPQRSVNFFHEVAEQCRLNEKSGKAGSSVAGAADKQKGEDAILAYLTKLGLAWKVK
jgi:hypothetical protein